MDGFVNVVLGLSYVFLLSGDVDAGYSFSLAIDSLVFEALDTEFLEGVDDEDEEEVEGKEDDKDLEEDEDDVEEEAAFIPGF